MEQQNNLQKILVYLNKIAWMIGIGLLAYFGRDDKGFVNDVWSAAKTASPFAAMLAILLFFDERRERREAQSQCNERTIDFIQTNHVASTALDKNSAATQKMGEVLEKAVATLATPNRGH